MPAPRRAAALRPRAPAAAVRRAAVPLPGLAARAGSAPAGGGALPRQRSRLRCDLGALLDPFVELVEARGARVRGIGAPRGGPVLHRREEFSRECPIARVQIEVRLPRIRDAIEPEVGLAP